MAKIEGRCLCGGVHFAINGPVSNIIACHCSMCRKAAGGAYGAFFVAQRADVNWLSDTTLRHYESSPNLIRSFCHRCGSAVTGANLKNPDDTIILTASMLDTNTGALLIAVENTTDRVHWTDNEKDAPHFEGAFPGWSDLKP